MQCNNVEYPVIGTHPLSKHVNRWLGNIWTLDCNQGVIVNSSAKLQKIRLIIKLIKGGNLIFVIFSEIFCLLKSDSYRVKIGLEVEYNRNTCKTTNFRHTHSFPQGPGSLMLIVSS